MDAIIELLRSDGSIIINKNLAKNIGIKEAILYSELLSRYIYFKNKEQLDQDEFFFNTIEDLKQGTTLSRYQQRKCIEKLNKLGLIDYKIQGIPAKRYFKIIKNTGLISNFLQTRSTETSKLEVQKLARNNTKYNNTKFNDTSKDVYKEQSKNCSEDAKASLSDTLCLQEKALSIKMIRNKFPDKNIITSDLKKKSITSDKINNTGPLQKNNNINYSDSCSSPSEKEKTTEDMLFAFWNKLEIRKHKIGTKTQKRIYKYFKHLIKGNFGKYVEIDKMFLNQNKIPHEWLSKKWTRLEIRKGIKRLALLFKEGYWPQDKSKLPKNLADLIYNTRTNRSFFFQVLNKQPQLLGKQQEKTLNEKIIKAYEKLFDMKNLAQQQKVELVKNVNNIIKFHNKINTNGIGNKQGKGGAFDAYVGKKGNYIPFCKMHIEWLQEWDRELSPNILSTYNKPWNSFLLHVKELHGFSLF